MVPETLKALLATILGAGLTTEEINTLGRQFDPRFNAHILSGQPFGITFRADEAARVLVNFVAKMDRTEDLIVMVINLSVNGDRSLLGRSVALEGMDQFLQKLGSAGLQFDQVYGVLKEVSPQEKGEESWGLLRSGEVYDFSYLSIDIAGNSQIQLSYPRSEIESVYGNLFKLLQGSVSQHRGRIWNWAGDGGIVAFYLGDRMLDAVRCALDIQLSMIQFNLNITENSLREPVRLRIACHDGTTTYKENKGEILSDAINYVAHLEKKGTNPESISISRHVHGRLPPRLAKIFTPRGQFENQEYLSVDVKLPWADFKD